MDPQELISPVVASTYFGVSIRGVILAVGLLLTVASLLPLLPADVWWVRVFDFPRVQLVVVTSVVALLYAALFARNNLLDAGFVGLLIVALAIQLWAIVPYTPFSSTQVPRIASAGRAPKLKLLIANVFQDNQDTGRLLQQVRARDPDIVLALETNQRWVDALSALKEDYPFTILRPLENTYGIALFSRLPLVDPEVKYLVQDDVPSVHANIALADGSEVRLFGLHPRPPSPTEHHRSTERDAELLVAASLAKKETIPVIVCGDMNDVAWSQTTSRFQRISGMLDPRIGRGIYATFSAHHALLRWPLDHVFLSDDFSLVSMERLPEFGSDHFPIFIEVALHPGAPEPEVTPGDRTTDDVRTAVDVIEKTKHEEGATPDPEPRERAKENLVKEKPEASE